MPSLPPSNTPLNRHSLISLENWLIDLGAIKNLEDPCLWTLSMPEWTADLIIKKDELTVIWSQNGKKNNCSFSYGLSREDVQVAINEGP